MYGLGFRICRVKGCESQPQLPQQQAAVLRQTDEATALVF